MSTNEIESNIDKIRELCRETLRALRSASEASRYGAALDHAIARKRLCMEVHGEWYSSLSTRAAKAYRTASDHPWNGDDLSRLTVWRLRMIPGCGETTIREIVDSLRARGIELPETLAGSVVVPLDCHPSA